MKVLLLSDFEKLIEKSGIGRAKKHQIMALESAGIEYTEDPKDDYDIIHINTIFPQSYVKAVLAKRDGKAVVYHAHSTEEDFRDSFQLSNVISPVFKDWLINCYTIADLILTPSQYSKELLEGYEIETPIKVISNGIDINYWQASDQEIKEFKDQYQIKEGEKVIISVGLQIKRKGILDFIEMAKAMPEYKFIWFGHTNKALLPIEIQKALETKLDNLFFPGYVDRDHLRVAYQASDLYVFPTYEETEGIVLLEALASKTNVLVRDLPVFSDYPDKEAVYKASSLEEFIDLSKKILEDELPSLVQAGYNFAEDKSFKNIGEKYKKYYQEALDLSKTNQSKVKSLGIF